MRRALRTLIVAGAVALVCAPATARADGFVSPWIGSAFGSSIDNGRTTFGVTAGAMGAGVIGGEVDFGYNPSFFGTNNDFGNNTVLNLMGNVIVGVPIGGQHGAGVRPYVTAGLGLLRSQIDGGTLTNVSSSNNMLGWNAGAGVMGYFNTHVGLRGDLRYLRGMQSLDTGISSINLNGDQLHFWRASIGVVLR
jgi:Outer membrane protein beta-barrel domain